MSPSVSPPAAVSTSSDQGWSSPFGLYWSAASVSYLGDGIRVVAVPLLAAALSSSAIEVALIAAAGSLPWLLFGLFAGVIVDRIDRLRAMAVLQLTRAAVVFAVTAAVFSGWATVPLLVVLVFVLSTLEVVCDVAAHSALPMVVRPARLQWANGRLVIAETVTFEFLGPALGGWLFARSAGTPLVVDGMTFLVAGLLLVLLARRLPPRPRDGGVPAEQPAAATVLTELAAGLRWFWQHRVLRSLTFIATAGNFGAGAFYAVFVLFAADELGLSPAAYGLLIGASAVGALGAGLIGDRIAGGRARRAVLAATSMTDCGCLVLIAAFPMWPVTAVLLTVFCFIVTVHNILAMSLRQALTPGDMIGRLTAAHRFLSWGSLPVGAVFAGVIAESFGLRAGIGVPAVLAGVLGIVAMVPLLRSDPAEFAIDEDPEP